MCIWGEFNSRVERIDGRQGYDDSDKGGYKDELYPEIGGLHKRHERMSRVSFFVKVIFGIQMKNHIVDLVNMILCFLTILL